MGKTIMVDPSKLTSTAGTIETYAGEYKKAYEQLLNEVDAMATSWSGTDNVSFTTQIKGFQDSFLAMYNLMMEYVDFLKNSSTAYTTAQSNIEQAAKKLTN
ncbi:MAG: WXG100 family type VII secretion target [Lachnospiraceae bacterium]|nr:WXG100 family type VII secretion target [Lachnospiraceae bacterium]